jgi:hypothetical protein
VKGWGPGIHVNLDEDALHQQFLPPLKTRFVQFDSAMHDHSNGSLCLADKG